MDTLLDGVRPTQPRWFDGLALVGGAVAAGLAAVVAAMLAVVFAVVLAMAAIMTGALIWLGGLVYRARRSRSRPSDPGLLEARNVGGHSWVAYSWDQRGR